MPSAIEWEATYLNGLCRQSVEATENGELRETSGCERDHESRGSQMTATEKTRLVSALDPLRRLTTGRTNADAERCSQGVTLHLVERSGRRLTWAFCVQGRELRGVDEVEAAIPEAVRNVMDAMDFGRD
jgi:hypothetical protein